MLFRSDTEKELSERYAAQLKLYEEALNRVYENEKDEYPSRKNVAGARNRTCSVRPDYVTTRYGNDSSSLSQQAR